MMLRAVIVLLCLVAMAGCSASIQGPVGSHGRSPEVSDALANSARAFVTVAERMEPVIERECLGRTRGVNCDFQLFVDDRPGVPANAFYSRNDAGRPIIVFTVPLIALAQNVHQLAFVLGHEAAHHISDHLTRQAANTTRGAQVFGGIAAALGGDVAAIQTASRLGATVGARSYSKEFELEADALGTVLTAQAGFDPILGAEFFNRIPDPGDRFLGTHPPNAERIAIVRQTAAGLR